MSPEYGDASPTPPPNATPGEVYAGYTQADLWVYEAFADVAPTGKPGFVTDWLGTRTRTTSLWDWARENDGQVTPRPVPHDLYEAIEWVGMLKAVVTAPGPKFTMMELGAGFGPWLGAASKAATLLGITDQFLLGVEADPGRFEMMRQHFLDNGLDPEQHRLICGAVGDLAGKARWPVIATPADSSGARPVEENETGLDRDDLEYMRGAVDGAYIDVEIHALSDLLKEQPVWDLVHIDVQGWEAKLCGAAIDDLSKKARWINVGTHSRPLDGQLIEIFHKAGWVLENEKPTRFTHDPSLPSIDAMTEVDGCQIWRNPKLVPGDSPRSNHRFAIKGETAQTPPETAATPDNNANTAAPEMQAPVPLRPQHVEGARLFADRFQAMEMFPRNARIAEVGVALGDYTQAILETCTPTRFDAFDIFLMHNEQAFWGKTSAEWLDNLEHQKFYERRFRSEIEAGQVGVHAGDSSSRLSEMPDEYYDLIYIDGDHSFRGAHMDAVAAAKKIKRDGMIVFNDYVMNDFTTSSPYGVVHVVNEFCVNGGWRVVYLALQSGMFCDIALKRA